jgi:hypothetical protein
MAEPFTPMQTHRTPDVALWEHWRARRFPFFGIPVAGLPTESTT